MRARLAVAVLLAAGVVVGATSLDKLVDDARKAFAAGKFKVAASKYLEASETPGIAPDRVADLALQSAWSSYIDGGADAAKSALRKAFLAKPQLEVLPEFYSQDFADLANAVKSQSAPPPLPDVTELKQSARQRLQQGLAQDVLYDLSKVAGSSDPEIHLLMAEAYDKLGKPDQARAEREKAAQLQSGGGGVTSTPVGALPPSSTPGAPAAPGVSAAPDVTQLIASAQAALDEKDYKVAQALAQQAQQMNPQSAPAHRVLGSAALALGDTATAERELVAAVTIDPADSRTQLGLARLADKSNQPNTAAAHYRRALELDPKSLDAALGLGTSLVAIGDKSGARLAFGRATEIDPNSAEARDRYGEFLASQGDAAGAVDQLAQAVRIAPDKAAYHAHLGAAYRADQKLPDAERELAAAVRIDPSDVSSWLKLADVQLAAARPADAAESYGKAIAIEPGNEAAVTGRAAALGSLGRWGEAKQILEQARGQLPSSAAVANDLGVTQYALSDLDGAVSSFEIAARLAPDSKPIAERLAKTKAARDLRAAALLPTAQ